MRKSLIVYLNGKPIEIVIRNYTAEDIAGMIEIQRVSFPPPFPSDLWWNEEQLMQHITRFPEGALCAEMDGKLIGSMTALRVSEEQLEGNHNWESITSSGYISNHDPHGTTLYVVDLCVVPELRKAGIGKWLMLSMYDVVVHLGLGRLLGGGRMPGYHKVKEEVSAEQYLQGVIEGSFNDPVISFLLRCGRMPVGTMEHYLEDEESRGYAALMEWRNPFLA
ncbi:ribosomal protein S18 acetylase RimI-like enzyme [Paenibacillus taihuensis]|uniref:Ribosomal protein S18 acetylase RimI-like enzyme n=1 Tax=Paenibacillus taihuensis TaxID=1156355 RepID=A0A3D9RTP2_9BACL|nr:GNAT family N-acetyltransferase [Paenibacillus taihuensis]REE80065.1 ribosomal protein S18 acetylase RimI-like enzyme [Paenibacillus taihuensis]